MENLERLELKLDLLLSSIGEIKSELLRIKESVYDPDNGLFIRVYRNTEYRKKRIKIDWLFITASVSVLVNMIWILVFGK